MSETTQLRGLHPPRSEPGAASTHPRFAEIYRRNLARRRPTISFELYPPRTLDDERTLFDQTIPRLMELRPAFMTMTYGAGGSTREKTLELAIRVKRETRIE